MERERASGERAVLERAAHEAGRHDGLPVVGERGRTCGREVGHLTQLLPILALADRGHEARRHDGIHAGSLDQGAEHRRRVDDRLRVRHREDRAVPAGCGGLGSREERLLVLAAGGAEVDVRVDERRSDDESTRRRRLDGRDDPVRDGDAQAFVDPLRGSEHPALEGERIAAAVPREEHYATSAVTRAGMGACVKTS